MSEGPLHRHPCGQGVACVSLRSAAAPRGAPPGKPWGTLHSTTWQAGRGMVWGYATGMGLQGSAAGPNLGNSNPCSCPRVSSRISSRHPVPAANPAPVVHKSQGPMCCKVCKISENASNMFFPMVLSSCQISGRRKTRFLCNHQRLKRWLSSSCSRPVHLGFHQMRIYPGSLLQTKQDFVDGW